MTADFLNKFKTVSSELVIERLETERSTIKIKTRLYSRSLKSHLKFWRPMLEIVVVDVRNAPKTQKNSGTIETNSSVSADREAIIKT